MAEEQFEKIEVSSIQGAVVDVFEFGRAAVHKIPLGPKISGRAPGHQTITVSMFLAIDEHIKGVSAHGISGEF